MGCQHRAPVHAARTGRLPRGWSAYISHYLGHGSVAVTMRYLALTPDDTREMLNRYSPVERSLRI